MMKRSKQPFTLIELLVSLTILSLIGALFAVKGKNLMENYAFKQEVRKVRDILQLAKEYAYCYQVDVEVVFSKSQHNAFIHIKTDEPLLQRESFFQKKYGFRKISFMDAIGDSIIFSGSGWVFPKSQLIVYGCQQKIHLEL